MKHAAALEIEDELGMILGGGQADKLYTASIKTFWPDYEKAAFHNDNRLARIDAAHTPDFASVADQQAEVNRIKKSAYAKAHWPKFAAGPPVTVVANTADEQFDAYTSGEANPARGTVRNVQMHLPTGAWGRSRAVLLHELAHAVEQYERAGEFNAFLDFFDDGHGPKFAKRNIEVVRQFYSKEMGNKLEANFKAGGVVIAP